MHPAAMWWWKRARHAMGGGCEVSAGCGPADHCGPAADAPHPWHAHGFEPFGGGPFGGGPFGVRRPLRFLAYKLDLDENQVAEVAKILDELKTERAQASVDDRRTAAALADALSGDAFDAARVGQAASQRVASAERLGAAVSRALERIHAVLRPEQRARLATLIRTGVVTI
ncbi:MAG: periplasmic heavy metal sensor [Deltaproteobacteria bacterium]|nr:periplasmic heavy metal sensor [Deltaproteobacteria bacterium]